MADIFSKVGVELQHNKKNLFGFEPPYFYEVTIQYSCKSAINQ